MQKLLIKTTALFTLLFSLSAFAGIEALEFDNNQQERDYHSITQELRCPQCQNNSIADSNATIAVDMRHKVLILLKQGQNEQEIVDYMVARYGNFVTYNPPLTASTAVLWGAPLLLIILGLGFILRRKSPISEQGKQSPSLNDNEQQRLNALLLKE